MAGSTIDSLNIPDFLKQSIKGAASTIQSTFGDLSEVMSKAVGASEAQQTAIKDSAADQVTVNTLIASRALATEAANKAQIAAFGTNPQAQSYVLSSLSQNILDIKDELDQRDVALQQKLDTKFSDDPIGWIANQFTVPGDILAYSHRAEALKLNSDVFDTLVKKSRDVVALNAAIDSGTNMDIVNAANKKLLADAAQKVAESQFQMTRLGLENINVRRALNKDQLDLMVTATSVDAQQQQLQLAKESGWRAAETLKLQKEMKELQIAEKEDKVAVDALIQRKLDKVSAMFGMNPITTKEYDRASGKLRDFYDAAMRDPDIENGRVAYNTSHAVDLANTYNLPLTPGMNYIRQKVVATGNKAAKQAAATGVQWEKLKRDEQLAIQQGVIEGEVKAEATSIPTTGGYYSPSSLSRVLNIPIVANLSITKDLLPFAKNEETPTDPSIIFKTASDKIARGESTPAQMAAEIKTMFQAVQIDNNQQRGYKRLVIPILSTETGYNMNVQTGLGWSNSQVINLTNSAQLESLLTRSSLVNIQAKDAQEAREAAARAARGGK